MRVVHVESGRHLYGGASQVRYLLDGLGGAGIENVLVCAAGGELAAVARPLARVVELPMCGDLDVVLVERLRRVLRGLEPDLVHVHSRRGADLFGGAASALAGVPCVLTRRVDSREPALWARLKYRPYARIVALSGAIVEQLRECGIERERVVTIPSAVDTERYRSDPRARPRLLTAFDLPPDALLIGVVAQIVARKGHDTLFRALLGIAAREPRVRVLCFGRGPLEARLRADLYASGLERHVVFAGFRADLPELLPGLDLLAHPAEREGLGVAVLEAASCGLPIVASAVGGIVDAIEDGRTGRLVAARDVPGLEAAVARLLADRVERARLGSAARREVARRFSVGAMIAAHVGLYTSVIDSAHAASVPPTLVERAAAWRRVLRARRHTGPRGALR